MDTILADTVAGFKMTLPDAYVAVFEILDELREQVWARYGLQIQQVLRDDRSTLARAAHDIDINEADVPF